MLTECIYSGICGAPSKACTPSVATVESCGFIAGEAQKKKTSTLPVAFCVSSAWCHYWKFCTLEFVKKFGCAAIDEAVAKKKTVTWILLERLRKEQGYETEGPWFEALLRELPSGGSIGEIEKAAWGRHIERKFGIRPGSMTSRPSLSEDDLFSRLEQI